MTRHVWVMLVAAVVWATAGCISPNLEICGDGRACPVGHRCIEGGCRSPAQMAACTDLVEGERCVVAGAGGRCMSGACITTLCGDGVVGSGEVCDDGNTDSGDGCDATCTSTEVCGNGIVELAEVCDCGDSTHPGPITCQGTSNGGQICNTSCRFRNCGDGTLDPGESCDDGNTDSGDGCRADCAKTELCGDQILDDGEGCDDGNTNAADGCDACTPTMWKPTVVLGGNQLATAFDIAPSTIAYDRAGNLYIGDVATPRIVRVAPDGTVTPFAGTGVSGYSGDGGVATSANIGMPKGITIDGRGDVYFAEPSNHRVRRVDTRGIITTIAGTGVSGFSGDGGLAVAATLRSPWGLAIDGQGRLFIADSSDSRIRLVNIDGMISTYAGTGTSGTAGDGGPATSAQLRAPLNLAIDGMGRLLVVDQSHRVRRIEIDGTIGTVAGTGSPGFSGDEGPATSAELHYPGGIACSDDGSWYISDAINSRVRKVDAAGTITTFAGTGDFGFAGDGGAATSATLSYPSGVAISPAGGVAIEDGSNRRVRFVDATGMVDTIAGTGATYRVGDGAAATTARIGAYGIGTDTSGRLLIGDSENHRVRRVAADGVLRTLGGTGQRGFSGDGGPAVAAMFSEPSTVIDDGSGNLLVSDTGNRRIRQISSSGIVTTVAGGGIGGDGSLATDALLDTIRAFARTADGDLLLVEQDIHRIRRVDHLTSTISTVLGADEIADFDGDDGDASLAHVSSPRAIAVNTAGDIYIADWGNNRVRVIAHDTNVITTFAGGGTGGDGPATDAALDGPAGLVVLANGDVYISESGGTRIRKVTAGTITTVAGTTSGFAGDGGLALGAKLLAPDALARASDGSLYIANTYNGHIRRIDPAGEITTAVGAVDPVGAGPLAQATLADPRAFVIGANATWFAGGSSGTLERVRANVGLDVVAGRYPQASVIGTRARYRGSSFGAVGGVAEYASAGVVFLTEGNQVHAVTLVDPSDPRTWTIAPIVNTSGAAGFSDGPATSAMFRAPTGLLLDAASQQLYVADSGNHVVRAIDLSNGIGNATVQTVAGTPATLGYAGDGTAAVGALLDRPQALARCPNGDMFVADTQNHRVRRIANGTNIISTVLGDGSQSSSGDGSPSSTFPVDSPRGIACDGIGNVFITSSTTVRFLAANASGEVDGTGPVRTVYGAPPRLTFPSNVTRCLTAIAVVDATRVHVTDACTGLLIELERMATP